MLKSTAADNSEDSSLLNKSVNLYAQCDEEGSEVLSSTDELVVINIFRKRQKSRMIQQSVQCLKRVRCLSLSNIFNRGFCSV